MPQGETSPQATRGQRGPSGPNRIRVPRSGSVAPAGGGRQAAGGRHIPVSPPLHTSVWPLT